MTLEALNSLSPDEAKHELSRCCGSRTWAERVVHGRPYETVEDLYSASEKVWNGLTENDWNEAFSSHPRIGETKNVSEKFSATHTWAAAEQSGTKNAHVHVLRELEDANKRYEARFGRIFIVCATGKSAKEMLYLIKERMKNDPSTELRVAAEEQAKITKLRIEKLLS
ncbi:MAG TPA: 2-oxo-4-hydroxy-4-carboxy-5-ureidoimidazoline decarboxylase [Bacteroidota bacterium]|nr:2-oxo-4-hydroxy-4-carboxy-5-ureidoimidazoline decarboxylase [Bacteroidota bacterium]